ncbi:MAG: neutral/alkaline non-lysosomal ceramidase N-terminal domain-containing protein [Phycisphaeraceae bacterium]
MPRAFSTVLFCLLLAAPCAAASEFSAGVAKVNITPQNFMWMSGYASRKKPADGKDTDLWAKVLVIRDAKGVTLVLVTLDLIGIKRDLSLDIRQAAMKKHSLELSQIALSTSHTHSGPVVGSNLMAMYFLDADQRKLIEDYAQSLKEKIGKAIDDAMKDLKPASLAWASGTCDFAVNRRNNPEASAAKLREEGTLKGPVDHDVPVLRVTGEDGKLRAIVFGYACHATVLDMFHWSGDYPGYAQKYVEEAHPGATALFWAGCGADQNPLPRRQRELADKYGKQLAESVGKVIAGEMNPVKGTLAASYAEIDLPFAKLPTKEELQERLKGGNVYEVSRAKHLLAKIEADGKLSATYPYPIQTWKLGSAADSPRWVLLGGEVVVDFALRVKRADGPTPWVAGYTNDVMAYIPSLRVLREGGYEGGGSMVYYGQPSVWGESVEEDIMKEVKRQAQVE